MSAVRDSGQITKLLQMISNSVKESAAKCYIFPLC